MDKISEAGKDLGSFFDSINGPLAKAVVVTNLPIIRRDLTFRERIKLIPHTLNRIYWHMRYKLAHWLYPQGWYTYEDEEDEDE